MVDEGPKRGGQFPEEVEFPAVDIEEHGRVPAGAHGKTEEDVGDGPVDVEDVLTAGEGGGMEDARGEVGEHHGLVHLALLHALGDRHVVGQDLPPAGGVAEPIDVDAVLDLGAQPSIRGGKDADLMAPLTEALQHLDEPGRDDVPGPAGVGGGDMEDPERPLFHDLVIQGPPRGVKPLAEPLQPFRTPLDKDFVLHLYFATQSSI